MFFFSEVAFLLSKQKPHKFPGILFENINIVEEALSKFIKRSNEKITCL